MQTTYSQNSSPIDEGRLKLFKNIIKKNIKTNPESQHKNIENEVNNKSNTLTHHTPKTAQNKPSNPVLNHTKRVWKTSNQRFNTHNLVNKVSRYQKTPHKVGLFWYS